MIVGKRNGSIFISTVISRHKATDWKSNPCTWSQGKESGCHNWFNEIKLKLKKKKKNNKKNLLLFSGSEVPTHLLITFISLMILINYVNANDVG